MNGVQDLMALHATYIGNEDKKLRILLLVVFRPIKLLEVVHKEQLHDFHLTQHNFRHI
jgi:hypothetical protein